MSKKHYLTEEQYQARKKRLNEIIHVELPRVAEELEIAKAQGDLSENAEYQAAKEHQAKLAQEKAELENELNNAIIIKQNESNEFVEIGHNVTIQWTDGTIETIKIVGYGDGKTEISYDSPLGNALLKRKVNDEIIFEAPAGRLKVKILNIF